jgi:hypothetical protein
VVYDRTQNRLLGYTPTGRELPSWPLPEPSWTEIDHDDFALAMLDVAAFEAAGSIELEPPRVDTAALLPTIYPRIRGDAQELASVLPRYTALHCSDDDALWLRRFDPRDGGLRGGRSWLMVEGEAIWRDVVFPERFDPFRFRGGRVWGVVRDALDVASIAWIEL